MLKDGAHDSLVWLSLLNKVTSTLQSLIFDYKGLSLGQECEVMNLRGMYMFSSNEKYGTSLLSFLSLLKEPT